MKNSSTTYDEYAQSSLSAQQAFPRLLFLVSMSIV